MIPTLSSALQPGQTFGRYQITRTLGVGSFGIVYEAVQYPLGRAVALKLLHDRTLTHPDALARFEREAMAAARLRHPHVVEVLDYGAHEGTAFLAMEVLEGESLQALMKRSGALPQSLTVDLMLPMVSAVAAVHDQGIIHRDLKPENILLTVTPERQWHPKLLDFGIAKVETQGMDLTRTNALLGTPCYMSPEQVMQARSIDGRADQWSIGVVLYECVTGVKPFYSDTLLILMTAITQGEPVPLRVVRSDIDPGFEAVVLRTLQRNPDDRYASMRDLGSALLPYASEAAQARWYAEFNETPPQTGSQRPSARTPYGAPRSMPPPPARPSLTPSFHTPDDEETRARREGLGPIDEPTELVNTTSQDGEFPTGFAAVQPVRSATSSVSQPGVRVSQSQSSRLPSVMASQASQLPPAMQSQPSASAQDLYAPAGDREVGTGTLAMDLDTAPGRLPPGEQVPRQPTGRMPPYKSTVEMATPMVPVIPLTASPISGVAVNPGVPYAQPQYGTPGAPMHYPPPMSGEGYPNGTFNLTSGEIQRPQAPRGSRRGLLFAALAVVLGGSAFGIAMWKGSQRPPTDDASRHATRPPAVPPVMHPVTPSPAAVDAATATPLVRMTPDASVAQTADVAVAVAAPRVTPDASVAQTVDASAAPDEAQTPVVTAPVAAVAHQPHGTQRGAHTAPPHAAPPHAAPPHVAPPHVAPPHVAPPHVHAPDSGPAHPHGSHGPRPPRGPRGGAPIF